MADITKIQPMGDDTQYTLGARYLTHTPNNTTTFLRGDNTWSNTLTGTFQSGPITITPENATIEGGQITLKADPNHPNYDGNLDVYNNYFRLFSSGGEKFKINLTDASLYNYGNVDIKGSFFVHNDASLKIYSQTNSQNYTGGNNENVCIQTCFDDQDPQTHAHVNNYENRCNLCLQPRGGQVYIGTNLTNLGDTSYSLYISGNTRNTGLITTDGVNYNYQSGHRIGSRHLDAGPAASWSDSRLYIGYGAIAPTKSIGFYYSADTSSRTQFAEINNNGMYANTRFGVNGQSTSYTLYVNGTGYFTNQVTATQFNGSLAWNNITGKPSTFTPSSHNHSYLPLSGGTLTGQLDIAWSYAINARHVNGCNVNASNHDLFLQYGYNAHTYIYRGSSTQVADFSPDGNIYLRNPVWINNGGNPDGNSMGHGIYLFHDGEGGNIRLYSGNCGSYGSYYWEMDAYNGNLRWYNFDSSGNYHGSVYIGKSNGVLYGACWNDYAEFRETCQEAKPGQCVIENGDDTLSLSTKRCQPGAQIVSDTYGFAIGEVEGKYETPLAVSGRVLAYTDVDRYKFKPGQAVCSGPNGTISRMRWYEKILWPERMIGFVSAIPEYEEWGNINAEVKVDNRIWIKVR